MSVILSKIQKLPLKVVSKPLGMPLLELQSVESTNKHAMGLIHEGLASHGLTILAHEQTSGRGQRGKSWHAAPRQNLTFSIIIDPRGFTNDPFQLLVCAAVTIWEIMNKLTSGDVTIKWPNDIYWKDRKISGILIENNMASTWNWSVVGVGVNVNQTSFPEELVNPVSLKQITGTDHDIIPLAKEICARLDVNLHTLAGENFESIFNIYNQHLYMRGQTVRIKKDNRSFSAVIKEVTSAGELIVEHSIEEKLVFGENVSFSADI